MRAKQKRSVGESELKIGCHCGQVSLSQFLVGVGVGVGGRRGTIVNCPRKSKTALKF